MSMDPYSRKLFQPREARDKLRGMGGIMASSPRLMETVQTYQAGGMVSQSSSQYDLQVPAIRNAVDGPPLGQRLYEAIIRKRANNVPVSIDEVRSAVESGELTSQQSMDLLSMLDDPGYVPSPAEILAANAPGVTPTTEAPARLVPRPRQIVDDYVAGVFGGRTLGEQRAIDMERASSLASSQNMDPATPLQMSADILPPAPRSPAPRSPAMEMDTGTPLDPNSDIMPPVKKDEPLIPDAETAPESFETTYSGMLKRLEGVMGSDSNEDTKKKAMANLAMIGLAIASGQSSNALTNIAAGALSGMQAISAQEAAAKEQDKALRMAALKATLDQQAATAATQAEMARDDKKFSNEKQLEILKAGLQRKGGQEISPLDPFAESVLRVAGELATVGGIDYSEALRQAYDTVRMLPGYSGMDLPSFESIAVNPQIKARVDQALSQNIDPAKIKADLEKQFPGIDVSLYGL